MQTDLLWLSISLFCSKSHWNKLISEGIEPFLNGIKKQKILKSYQLEFNYLEGENIRLSLLTHPEKAEALARNADRYFKKFFLNASLLSNEPNLADPGVFMPILSNTIRYDLYKTESISDRKQNYFQEQLSNIIIEGLRKENIDQETIITFAFYLHMAFLKLIIGKYATMEKEFLQLYNVLDINVIDEDHNTEFIKDKYENNKEVMQEIANDIMNPQSLSEDVPYWLKKWMKLCEDKLNSYGIQDKEAKLMTINTNIIFDINKHLGVADQMKLLLYFFIKQVILPKINFRFDNQIIDKTMLINYLINKRNCRRYLEIGVNNESYNFAYINCDYKVGVDPKPVTTVCSTSNEFFSTNSETFDIIFINELHTEEQMLKDISNALCCLSIDGIIVLHGCMPQSVWHEREVKDFSEGEEWNVTVWKAALRVFNQTSFKCILLNTDFGCGIIDTAHSQVPLNLDLPKNLYYKENYRWLLQYKTSVADYLLEQVKVFYHLACMGNWQEVFTEQMKQLEHNNFRSINLIILGTKEDTEVVDSICGELNLKVNIVFQNPAFDFYERPSMLAIEEYARQNDGFVLYLHSKGVSNPHSHTKKKWRRLMMNELVENSACCLQQLSNYDIIGVNWSSTPNHFSGNFWYASTSYLRKLSNFKQFYEHPNYHFADPFDSRRLSCEFWIGSAGETPRVLSLVGNDIDFYFCTKEFWEKIETRIKLLGIKKQAINAYLTQGFNYRQLAEKYGLSMSTIKEGVLFHQHFYDLPRIKVKNPITVT